MKAIVSLVLLVITLVASQQSEVCTDIYPPELCQGIQENTFVSSFRGCPHWVQCIGGNVVNCGSCLHELYFDPPSQTCTYRDLAQCTGTPEPPPGEVVCPDVGGVSLIPDPTSCQNFYICAFGNPPERHQCPSNYNFCQDMRFCRLIGEAVCILPISPIERVFGIN